MECAFDPWQAHQTVVHVQQRFGEDAILEQPPHVMPFSTAMKELEALVADGRFHHDGNPILSWAMSNVVCHRDKKGNIYPNKVSADKKIDPVVALLMAVYRWTAYQEDSEPTISFV